MSDRKKIDWNAQKKKADEYVQYLENQVKTNQDIVDWRFQSLSAVHAMLAKVMGSKSTAESKQFWMRNIGTLYHAFSFIERLARDNNDLNRYNEHNFNLSQKLMEKNKALEAEVTKLQSMLEDKFIK